MLLSAWGLGLYMVPFLLLLYLGMDGFYIFLFLLYIISLMKCLLLFFVDDGCENSTERDHWERSSQNLSLSGTRLDALARWHYYL